MLQDVGIAEQQKVRKQGRDSHIKQSSIQPPTSCYIFNIFLLLVINISQGGVHVHC